MVVPEDVINRGIGVQLGTAQMADLLSRMQLQAEPVQGQQAVRVMVPPTRSDVLHACDVMEVHLADTCAQLTEHCCAQAAPAEQHCQGHLELSNGLMYHALCL